MRFNLRLESEFDGIEYAVDFILRDSYIRFCYLDACVVQDSVQQQQAFCAVIVRVIHISAKCLAERVRREILYFQTVLVLEYF